MEARRADDNHGRRHDCRTADYAFRSLRRLSPALGIVLRQCTGYVTATRQAERPGASIFERILIVATSSATAAPARASAAGPPWPAVMSDAASRASASSTRAAPGPATGVSRSPSGPPPVPPGRSGAAAIQCSYRNQRRTHPRTRPLPPRSRGSPQRVCRAYLASSHHRANQRRRNLRTRQAVHDRGDLAASAVLSRTIPQWHCLPARLLNRSDSRRPPRRRPRAVPPEAKRETVIVE
jgi:hypothetical protein